MSSTKLASTTSSSELCVVCGSDDDDEWIQCDRCDQWVHFGCIDIPRRDVRKLERYFCTNCDPGSGSVDAPSKRQRTIVNYRKLHNGILEIGKTHPHARYFANGGDQLAGSFKPKADSSEASSWERIPVKGEILETPTLVRAKDFEILDMHLPPLSELTVRNIAAQLGEDSSVPVMDVVTQDAVRGWTLGLWRDYFETPAPKRQATYNVISLEVSGTAIGKAIKRPEYVRERDLVDRVFSDDEESAKPKVKLYCLMSVSGSYTDFHVDFGGTSVFYHVVQGRKTFLFVAPTRKNLAAYERWCNSSDQHSTWFPSLLPDSESAQRVDLEAGDSLFIPSGWIHAVYTSADAVVIGGNFLTVEDGSMQLRIDALEKRTRVETKYRFPKFRETMLRTSHYLLEKTQLSLDDIATAKALIEYLEGQEQVPQVTKELKQRLERLNQVDRAEAQADQASHTEHDGATVKPEVKSPPVTKAEVVAGVNGSINAS